LKAFAPASRRKGFGEPTWGYFADTDGLMSSTHPGIFLLKDFSLDPQVYRFGNRPKQHLRYAVLLPLLPEQQHTERETNLFPGF
jgi:hypothetical protein